MPKILRSLVRIFNITIRGMSFSKPPVSFPEQHIRVEDILENISDGFFAVDENWIVRYYNKAAENILLPRHLIINKNLWEVFSDAVGSRFYNEYQRVMNDRVSSTFEEFYPTLDLWVQINVSPAEKGISIFFRDITDSKRKLFLESLENEVLTSYTSGGSSIEGTIQQMLDGVCQMHPDLACSFLSTGKDESSCRIFSHLPEPFAGTAMQMELSGFFKEKRVTIDIASDSGWSAYRDLAVSHGLRACFSDTLADPYQRVLGTFTTYLRESRPLKPAEETSIERAKNILKQILENHHTQQIIKTSEGKYRDLFHWHPLPLWLYDVETTAFLDVNEAAVRQYGYSRDEFLNMTIRDIRLPEDMHLLERQLEINKTTGTFSAGIFRHKKKSGEIIHVEIRGNLIDFNGADARLISSIDLTEKVKTEEALALSEKRFKALVQEGSDLINIMDLNGVYTYASPASAAMIGLTPETIAGANAFDFIHEDDHGMIMELVSGILSTKRVQTRPFRFKAENGEYRWLQSIGTNLLDDPAVRGIVVNSKDITESIQYIQRIEAQNKKFRDIAWIQSHVVRAPLSRLMGLIGLVTVNEDEKPLNSELLGHVLASAHELDSIIHDIVKKTEQVDQ